MKESRPRYFSEKSGSDEQKTQKNPEKRENYLKIFFTLLSKIKRVNLSKIPRKKEDFVRISRLVGQTFTFVILLFVYLFYRGLRSFVRSRFFPKIIKEKVRIDLTPYYLKVVAFLDRGRTETISRVDLIELAIQNMKVKKNRTVITIGGMAIGICAIVFLVSIGYGLERLVISRVARLEEMRQADISLQTGSQLKIDDKAIASFNDIKEVESALPMIAVVGRVNYQNSVSDMAVYGVTTEYLKRSAIKPNRGDFFESNELSYQVSLGEGEVAGEQTELPQVAFLEKIQDVEFSVTPGEWIRVRELPRTNAKILGYTKRVEGQQAGVEVWGGRYQDDQDLGEAAQDAAGNVLGRWLKAPVLLWEEVDCEPEEGDCEEGGYKVLRDEDGRQVQEEGYFAEINLTVNGASIREPEVLGVSIKTQGGLVLSATDSAEMEIPMATGASIIQTDDEGWVEIASESAMAQAPEVKQVEIGTEAKKEAVVNEAMLGVLGVNEDEALGKTFLASFVVVGDLLALVDEKIESVPVEYKIVGVIPEGSTPIFYVPFMDLRSLGITNYSQVKLMVNHQGSLEKVRQQVEAMGFNTRSVADTVAQINSLFGTARTVFALLGMVALAVASLGMFNTLTISLLERTREVGLMKALGMKSSEVKELFLTESMVMGFFGGMLGIFLGFLSGKIIGFILSFFAIFKGVGFVDVSFVPFHFVLVVIILSFLVGLITGIYPAKRATKISALNALRYE